MMAHRKTLLIALLRAERPVRNILSELDKFPWDSTEELVTLTPQHLVNVLSRFLTGDLSDANVGAWASAVEGREDIGFESAFQDVLKQCVFQLATPELGYSLTKEFAQEWIDRLTRLA
ncbi:MAG: hypothetical protein AB1473_23290 [Thermodesulfobacteriota bacterium]